MRILIATAGSLDATRGAGQIALSLARALEAMGHEAEALGVEAPAQGSPWRRRALLLRRIAERAREAGPLDVLDVPPPLAGRELRNVRLLVVRSVQPELRYLGIEARRAAGRAVRGSLRDAWSLAWLALRRRWVVSGWRRGDLILCLGTRELDWMRARRELAGRRLCLYWAAPAAQERPALARLRRRRRPWSGDGVRFLWLGRWSAHKGTPGLERFARERLARHPGDSLTIAGCGIEPGVAWPEPIRSRIRQRLSFRRDELPALLAEHDVGLFTSEAEGWGISVQEMLESGLPVLATREGAVPELEPYFPGAIEPFPPPPDWCPPRQGVEPGRGYEERYHWSAIARAYTDAVVSALAAPRP